MLLSEGLWLEQRIPFVDDYAFCHATWFVPKFKPVGALCLMAHVRR